MKYRKLAKLGFLITLVTTSSMLINESYGKADTSVCYNVTVKPKPSSKKEYTVLFLSDKGGKLLGNFTQKVSQGTKIKSLPAVKVDKNYKFKGWYTKSNKKVNPQSVIITSNTTFKAEFDKIVSKTSALTALYRIYNPRSGEHFYTKSKIEKDSLVRKNHWRYEGVAWYSPSKGDAIYRVYNPRSGEHFYTKSKIEKDSLVRKNHWRYEGVAWYSPSKGDAIYRIYNPRSGEHFYTKSKIEKDSLVRKNHWKYEGIAWYGQKNKN